MVRFLEGLVPTLPIAHRGGASLAPENTLHAFRPAVEEHGARMLETDVQVSRDGVLVVTHDPTVERTTDGEGRVRDLTFRELAALDAGFRFTNDGGGTFPFRGRGVRLSRLEELLAAFPDLRLNVELKPESAGAERLFAEVVRRAGAVDRVCVGSEDDAVGAALHEALPEACHFFPRQALTDLVLSLKWGQEPPREDRYTVLDLPLTWEGARIPDAAFFAAVRARGLWANVWTVDDPAEMRALVAEGCGGIMTDRPDLLAAVLRGA